MKRKVLSRREIWLRILTGLIGLVFSAICAHIQNWSAHDLLWGLWGTSLVVGFTYIIALIAVSYIKDKSAHRPKLWEAFIFAGFMSVHFLGFHYGHGMFVSSMFPVTENAAKNYNFIYLVGYVMKNYWVLILAAFVPQFMNFPKRGLLETDDDTDNDKPDPLMSPYRNVAKMHIMIFILMAFEAMKKSPLLTGENPDNLIIYGILVMFFFPWKALGIDFAK